MIFTALQISSIISLLFAFGVSTSTVNAVLIDLNAANNTPVAVVQSDSVPQGSAIIQTPTPAINQPVVTNKAMGSYIQYDILEVVTMGARNNQTLTAPAGDYLRVFSNVALNFEGTLFPDSDAKLGQITANGVQDTEFKDTRRMGYYYEALITGAMDNMSADLVAVSGDTTLVKVPKH